MGDFHGDRVNVPSNSLWGINFMLVIPNMSMVLIFGVVTDNMLMMLRNGLLYCRLQELTVILVSSTIPGVALEERQVS